MLQDQRLGKWYRQFNRRWFGGKLPAAVEVLYVPVQGCCGEVRPSDVADFTIKINPAYAVDTRMVRLTLLHEMVHISIWPNISHGPKFQAEMQRLAATGAFRDLW